jgi:hypothetical protein
MLPGRASPSAWLDGPRGDRWAIADGGDHGSPSQTWLVAAGEVVEFIWSEDRPSARVDIRRDGSFRALDIVAPDATHFWCERDADTMAEDLSDFCRFWAENEFWREGEEERRVTVDAYVFSDALPHRLVADAAGVRFEQVEVTP